MWKADCLRAQPVSALLCLVLLVPGNTKAEAEGKEPAYYGATVTAADSDKVLVQWKLDDGRCRVIFGDLRIEDVSAERLEQLEAK